MSSIHSTTTLIEKQDPFVFEDIDRESALLSFRAQLVDLKESGYSDPEIYQLMREFNNNNMPLYTLTDEEFAQETSSLNMQPDQPAQDKAKELKQAIANKDAKAIWQLVDVIVAIKRLNMVSYGLTMAEIKEACGKSINMVDLKSAVAQTERNEKLAAQGKQPDVADVAYKWSMEHRDLWAYDTDCRCWRMYNGEYWQERDERGDLLDQYAVAAMQAAEIPINSSNTINTFERLASSYCKREFTRTDNKINFKNGTLDIDTMQLCPFCKEDNFTYCLPYSYDPHSGHPNIDKFLTEVLPDEHARLAFMAHGGLALLRDVLVHQFMGMIGATRSGKSTLLALLNALCGALDAYEFAGPSIFSREVEGKRSRFKWKDSSIVAIDELPQEALRDEENLKLMSAHSGVEMRGIGRDEHKKNRWIPKLIFTTNDQPSYKDNSSAVKERAVFTEVNKAKPKEERNPKLFVDKLLPEIGAFAASCIELALQARDLGYYPQSKKMKMLMDRIANESNPLKHFLFEFCALGPVQEGYKVESARLYGAFKTFCDENGHSYSSKINKTTFAKELRMMNVGIEPKKIRFGNMVEHGLAGVKIKEGNNTEDNDDSLYQDDNPLQKPERMLTVVDGMLTDVDRLLTVENATGNILNQPVEPDEDTMLTVLTVKESNVSYRNDIYLQQDTHISLSNKAIGTKQQATPSTNSVNDPVKPSEGVDGMKNNGQQPSTDRQQPSTKKNGSKKHYMWGNNLDERGFPRSCQLSGCNDDKAGFRNGKWLCQKHLDLAV